MYTWDGSWERKYLPTFLEMRAEGYAGDASQLQATGREYSGEDSDVTVPQE